MADNTGTYAEQAAAGDITRYDSTPVFPQQIIDYLIDQETVSQEDVDNAVDAIRSS